jgi:hypothetical protein
VGIIKPGIKCKVIGRVDCEGATGNDIVFDGKSPNIGRTVVVVNEMKPHPQIGRVWRCQGVDGDLITYWGVVSIYADFSEYCLDPLPPEPVPSILNEDTILVA